jgi:hypothetical protein
MHFKMIIAFVEDEKNRRDYGGRPGCRSHRCHSDQQCTR